MHKEQESIQALMEQLINSKDPEEVRELTARVRHLATQTASPEARLEMYHQARQAVQTQLLEMAEKKDLGAVTSLLLQESKRIRQQGVPSNYSAAHGLLALLHPVSAALADVADPAAARYLIRQARHLLMDVEDQVPREAGGLLLCQMMEDKALKRYLEEIQRVGEPEPSERFLSSLLQALETPTNPALALSFLQYNIDQDIFYTVTPAKLAEVAGKEALTFAMMDYVVATPYITWQEMASCTAELKRHILLRFLLWLEDKDLSRHKSVGLCADTLQRFLHSNFTAAKGWDKEFTPEPFKRITNAIGTTFSLGTEMNDNAFKTDSRDQAEIITMCPYFNGPLVNLTVFALVIRLLQTLADLSVVLPADMECLMRVYLVLSLSSPPLSSDAAFAWALAPLSANEK